MSPTDNNDKLDRTKDKDPMDDDADTGRHEVDMDELDKDDDFDNDDEDEPSGVKPIVRDNVQDAGRAIKEAGRDLKNK